MSSPLTQNFPLSTSTQYQISQQFFPKIPELSLIEESFNLSTISHQLAVRDFQNQFQLIRALTETKKHKIKLRTNSVFESKKNRYPEQSIFDHSRVHITNCLLPTNPPSEQPKSKQKSDYINANYTFYTQTSASESPQFPEQITILSQAPLLQTLPQFVSMIVNNKITCVVMLCNVIENGKNRCYDYLHDNPFFSTVQYVGKDQPNQSGVEIRRITVGLGPNGDDGEQQFHEFYHILFTEWPDKSVPESPSAIQSIIAGCSIHNRILIHCSAGLGRSGVVGTIVKIMRQMEKGGNKVSVFGSVRCLRQDRYGAVQNNQQYKFIYKYLQYYFKKLVERQKPADYPQQQK